MLLLVGALFLLPFVERGWIPADVGHLGQSAERVLHGELPHRDFDDTYTGGLVFVHAAVFKVFGVDASALRWLLYASQLLSLPLIYRLARGATAPLPAAGAALLGLVWGVPLYFEAMPSWFNLFLAIAAISCLLRARDGQAHWLVLAGLAVGASIAIKSVGLLVLAAALLYFVFLDQESRTESAPGVTPSRLRSGSWFTTLGLISFLACLVAFVSQWPTVMNLIHFVVPGAALVFFLLWREWRGLSATAWLRMRSLARLSVPFLLGVSLPLIALAIPFARQGALAYLLDFAVLFPADRVDRTYYSLPHYTTLICLVPIALVFLLGFFPSRVRALDRTLALPALLGAVLLLAFGSQPRVYQLVWFAARPLVPLLVVAGCIHLARGRMAPESSHRLFLLLAVTALSSLIQFPQSMGLYFGYVAPLVVLAYLQLASAFAPSPRRLHAVVAVLFAGYGLLWVVPSRPLNHGVAARPVGNLVALGLERADLRVSSADRAVYHALVGLIQEASPSGSCIWAGPDAPQVYFLADRCNPTPTLWEIFDPDYGSPDHPHRILNLIAERDLPVAVLHLTPAFSRPSDALVQGLERHFRRRATLREFIIYWEP